jgi:uncharacterized protein involved in outer membrane biogenesis
MISKPLTKEPKIMRISKPVRWILYVVGGLMASLFLMLVFLAFVRISIDLSNHKSIVEKAASLALDRTVKVDDKIVISTSLRPIFSLGGLLISNPKGFQEGDFLKMKTAEVQVRVLPLLLGKLKISKFSVKGLVVMLVENKAGNVNWSIQIPTESKPEASPKPQAPSEEGPLELTSDSLVLTKLVLEDISVDVRRPALAEPLQFKIEECTGTMLPGKPLILSMKGNLVEEPYSTAIEVGSLQELLEENRSWMKINIDIAQTRFQFEGALDLARALKSLQLNASVAGDRLDSLNGLLDLDLPPLKSYTASAQLTMRGDQQDLSDFVIQVGESKLTGKMTADYSGDRTKAVIELSAPLIQLNDFDVGDWSPEKSDGQEPANDAGKKKKTESGAAQDKMSSPAEATAELLSPEVLERADLRMTLKAQKVMSGTDELGSGSLTAILKDGRFSIDPVKLNIPGGSFAVAASLKPSIKAPQVSLRAVMKNFDFGVLVRRANPKADMGGIINLDVDLKSSADSFDKLMANGNGYFDFSGRLENLEAGIIDLWAVNVIAAVATSEDDEASKINCVVGRWTMKDGLLKPNVFLIDTNKIRICGKGQVDFRKEHIDLKMAPAAKKPEFFSLATPVEVNGNFADFGVGIQAGGLVGTAIRFITSPLHVPFRRLAGEKLPADGADVCSIAIGPSNRSQKPPAGCK